MVHTLFMQFATPFWDGHTLVQLPQCCLLLVMSTQAPLQSVSFAGHDETQVPCEHSLLVVPAQFFVQLPQCAGVDRSISQPLLGSPSQSARPVAHATILHLSASHPNVVTFEPEHAAHAV